MTAMVNRRQFVQASGTTFALPLLGALSRLEAKPLSPASESWPAVEGKLAVDEATRLAIGRDLGGLVITKPAAVLRPASADDVTKIVRFASARSARVAIRGDGHSNFGQTQVDGGIVIDTSSLDNIGEPNPDWVDVQPGAFWSDVVATSLAKGLTPVALTVWLNLTVGGVLSVGGLGPMSLQRGAVIDHVLELDVITGEGRFVTCSPTKENRLFEAMLGGFGQCGVIVRARISLQPAPGQVASRTLHYKDLGRMLRDVRRISEERRFDAQQGLISHGPDGVPVYSISCASFHSGSATPNLARLIADLEPFRAGEVHTMSYSDYVNNDQAQEMVQGVTGFSKPAATTTSRPAATGPLIALTAWIPESGAQEFFEIYAAVQQDMADAPYHAGPITRDGYFYPLRPPLMTRPLLKMPISKLAFSALMERKAADSSPESIAKIMTGNRRLLETIKRIGGKRYPSQAGEPMAQVDWPDHYGSAWAGFRAAKREFDPKSVLSPGLRMFA